MQSHAGGQGQWLVARRYLADSAQHGTSCPSPAYLTTTHSSVTAQHTHLGSTQGPKSDALITCSCPARNTDTETKPCSYFCSAVLATTWLPCCTRAMIRSPADAAVSLIRPVDVSAVSGPLLRPPSFKNRGSSRINSCSSSYLVFSTARRTTSSAMPPASSNLISAQQPVFIYGTAWKKEKTSSLVKGALRAGFRAVDTAAQPRHYQEELVGSGLREAYREGLVRRDGVYVS